MTYAPVKNTEPGHGTIHYPTCPVNERTMDRLNAFRAAFYRATGERPSIQHAIGDLLEMALDNEDADHLASIVASMQKARAAS